MSETKSRTLKTNNWQFVLIRASATNTRHFDMMDADKKKERARKNQDKIERKRAKCGSEKAAESDHNQTDTAGDESDKDGGSSNM